jgi:hypothetical protein
MCLFTTQKRNLTAKEDIVVYKVLREDLASPIKGFRYEYDKVYKTKIGKRFKTTIDLVREYEREVRVGKIDCLGINRGFHSCVNVENAIKLCAEMQTINLFSVYHAVIPKGSKYCKGMGGDIVSDQLIIKEVL